MYDYPELKQIVSLLQGREIVRWLLPITGYEFYFVTWPSLEIE